MPRKVKWKCLRLRGHSFLLWHTAFGRASVISKKGMFHVFFCAKVKNKGVNRKAYNRVGNSIIKFYQTNEKTHFNSSSIVRDIGTKQL